MQSSEPKVSRRIVALLVIGLVLVTGIFGGVRMFSSPRTPETIEKVFQYPDTPPEGMLPEGVRPLRYALDLRIIPQEEYFSGTASIEIEVDLHTWFIWLHGRDLNVSRVEARKPDGSFITAKWEQVTDGGVARVTFDSALAPGSLLLQIEYEAPYSKNPDGLYKVIVEGKPMVFSQFSAIDARRAFPGFDEPRFKVPFDISIIAPVTDQVVTNAPRIDLMLDGESEALSLFETSVPVNTAIVSVAIGDLEVIEVPPIPASALRENAIPLRGFARKGRGQDMTAMLEATVPLLLALETYFGQPYPYQKLDLVAVPDFAWGGMENAASIFYREDSIFVDSQTTAGKYNNVVDTHAHELAHQWFGNLVTPRWWDDIWLSESFASWISGKALASWKPELSAENFVKRYAHNVMKQDSLPSTPVVYQVIENNEDILGSFSDISYSKGGGILEMFEAYVGPDDFREGVAMFVKRHKGGSATLDDFVEAISIGSRRPEIASAFRSFVTQPGLPIVETAVDCTKSIKEISFMQTRYTPIGSQAQDETFWEIPVCYRTNNEEGCTLLTQKRQTVRLGKSCPAFVMPNRNASGYYLWSLDEVSLKNMRRSLKKLKPIETEALAWNLGFWFRSDRISAAQTLELMRALAKLERPRTDLAVLATLIELRPFLTTADDREALDSWTNRLYQGRARGLGLNPRKSEAVGRTLLRDTLTDFLIGDTGEPEIRERLYKALDKSDLSIKRGLPGGLSLFKHNRAEAIVTLGVLDNNKAFTDDLVALIQSGQAESYDHLIMRSLARTRNKGLGRRLMDEFLLSDTLRAEAVFTLAEGLARNPDQREGFWTWTGRANNLSRFLTRLPEAFQYELVTYGMSICDGGQREIFVQVIGAQLDKIAGGAAEYVQALEAIDQCLAIREAKGAELTAALQ